MADPKIEEMLDTLRGELKKAGYWSAHITMGTVERQDGEVVHSELSGFKTVTIDISPPVAEPVFRQRLTDEQRAELKDQMRGKFGATVFLDLPADNVIHSIRRINHNVPAITDWTITSDPPPTLDEIRAGFRKAMIGEEILKEGVDYFVDSEAPCHDCYHSPISGFQPCERHKDGH